MTNFSLFNYNLGFNPSSTSLCNPYEIVETGFSKQKYFFQGFDAICHALSYPLHRGSARQWTYRAYSGSYTCQNLIESHLNMFLATVISTAPPRPLSKTLKMSHRTLCRTIRLELAAPMEINVRPP